MNSEELSAWGLQVSDYAAETVDVWPENWEAVQVFEALLSQWRMGFNGPIGLDYAAIPVVLRLRGVARKVWRQIFDDIRIMERAALDSMRET